MAIIIATACATPSPTSTSTPTPTGTPMPTPTLDPTLLPLPGINDIPDMENTPTSVKEKTISTYQKMRKALYDQGHQYVEPMTGKIQDAVVVALIISAELGVFKDWYPEVYKEALEALSNQYDSGRKIHFSSPGNMLCYGSCTVKTQIAWLYDMEGIRADNFIESKVESKLWANYLTDGQSAVNGYVYGQNSSWFWGNVTKEELCQYNVVKQAYVPGEYPGKPYFIVHGGRAQC
jgi:hypothetical protein